MDSIEVVADRIGQFPVLIAGYVLGVLMAVLMAVAFWMNIDSVSLLACIFFNDGLFIAVQEALEPTVTAEMVQPDTLTTCYGALGTVNGTTKFPVQLQPLAWCGLLYLQWLVSGWQQC